MTLDEAIIHAEEQAELLEESARGCDLTDKVEKEIACKSGKCAAEHRQLAEWLKELKEYKQQNVSDNNVGKTEFRPGDKFILELGQEHKMFDEFEIKGTDLYVKTNLLEKLTRYEPEIKAETVTNCHESIDKQIKRNVLCGPDCEGFVCHKNGIYGWCPKAERWGCDYFYELERQNNG